MYYLMPNNSSTIAGLFKSSTENVLIIRMTKSSNTIASEDPVEKRSMPNVTPQSFLRRYKWNDLTVAEKDAVNDAMILATTRAGVGLGAVLTAAVIISNGKFYLKFWKSASLALV